MSETPEPPRTDTTTPEPKKAGNSLHVLLQPNFEGLLSALRSASASVMAIGRTFSQITLKSIQFEREVGRSGGPAWSPVSRNYKRNSRNSKQTKSEVFLQHCGQKMVYDWPRNLWWCTECKGVVYDENVLHKWGGLFRSLT